MSASRPLAAVTSGGHDTVSCGSTSATRGIISGLRKLALRAMFRRGEHGVGGDLRAGASRGGHRDAGHGRLANRPAGPDDLQVVQRVTAVTQQHGHSLAGIDDAAPANRGHHVSAVLTRGGHPGPGQSDRRLPGDLQHRGGQPHAGQQPGMTRPVRARAHQHPRSEPGQHLRQVRYPPRTGDNAAGRGELELHRGHGAALAQPRLPAGNTTEYRIDCRGSAIISATASRQAA